MNPDAFHIGKPSDSYDYLQALCKKEAERLTKVINLSEGEKLDIPCWTNFPGELICTITFKKDNNGIITYTIDESQSTL